MNTFKSLTLALILAHAVNAFVGPSTNAIVSSRPGPISNVAATQMNMVPVDMDTIANVINSAPSIMLSETEPWVKPMYQILGPFLNIFSFAMVSRFGRNLSIPFVSFACYIIHTIFLTHLFNYFLHEPFLDRFKINLDSSAALSSHGTLNQISMSFHTL
jgi:hypothetical protein